MILLGPKKIQSVFFEYESGINFESKLYMYSGRRNSPSKTRTEAKVYDVHAHFCPTGARFFHNGARGAPNDAHVAQNGGP